MKSHYCLLFCIYTWLVGSFAYADSKDVIRIPKASSSLDSRFQYPEHILELALNASIEKFGPYELIRTNVSGTRARMLLELESGKNINVHNAPTRPEWEEKTIPIMFPIMKGLLNYRIFLIHEDNLHKFKKIKSIKDLKQLVAGVGAQWSTTMALKKIGGFKIETGNSYEGLFGMLMAKRFDYFIRGMNEVYREYEERKDSFPQLMIEPHIVMELPLPWFIFVSPKFSRIADRITYGLNEMKINGSFDKEFFRVHAESIKKANLSNRKVFRVKNKLLNKHAIYDDPTYWFHPSDDIEN